MSTVGYGDLHPNLQASHELLLNMFMQLLGTTIFAYVIGAVMNLVLEYDPASKKLKEHTNNIMEYCKEGELPPMLTIRAMRQIEV